MHSKSLGFQHSIKPEVVVPVISTLETDRQEDSEFKVILGYKVNSRATYAM